MGATPHKLRESPEPPVNQGGDKVPLVIGGILWDVLLRSLEAIAQPRFLVGVHADRSEESHIFN